jgi:hypothetical protein
MATDRLTLARAFQASGMERQSAEDVATAIFDAIYANVATKADLERMGAATKADIERLGATTKADVERLGAATKAEIDRLSVTIERLSVTTKTDIAALRADMNLLGHQLMTRLGGLIVVVVGIMFAALHYWPPH